MKSPRLSTIMTRMRLAALRAVLNLIGFDVFSARRICREAEELQTTKSERDRARAEIHMLATGLGLLRRDSREDYERVIKTFFPGHRSSSTLTDEQHRQFLNILRGWKRAAAVAKDKGQRAA